MTVLVDDDSAEPGTHALVIGVGGYRHLEDGPPEVRFSHTMAMGDLTSPEHSMTAFLNWLGDAQTGYHNPDRPLRSLQALGTPKQQTAPIRRDGQNLNPASSAHVKQALKDWKDRASKNDDNIALLYFCGHGLAFAEMQNALLLDDFGSDEDNPMSCALAFDEMRIGLMRHCKARHQVHLIDACRIQPTRAFREKYGQTSVGQPVFAGGISPEVRDKVAPAFFATGLAAPAYARDNRPSVFTTGFLQSVKGSASRDVDQHWEVTIQALAEGVNRCVAGLEPGEKQLQYCQPRDTGHALMLHRIRGGLEIPVKVFTRDGALMSKSVLSHRSASAAAPTERPPHASPWWVSLNAGPHEFKAVDAASAVTLGTSQRNIAPPGSDVGLP